jgi:pyruvate dehydrogenase kinase 2/3/4
MVQFGPNPSPGSIFLASQFIVEELPIRLAKKVKDLEAAPFGLHGMPSTVKVRNWYAQSFEELVSIPKPVIDDGLKKLLESNKDDNSSEMDSEENTQSHLEHVFADDGIILKPSHHSAKVTSIEVKDSQSPTYGLKYYTSCPANIIWPKQVYDYNKTVNDVLTKIKKRHDATVATMAQGVQEWKQQNRKTLVNSQIQAFLDRFYMSRIGIRMLIGQHIALNMAQQSPTKQRISQFFNGGKSGRSNYVGVICTDCNVAEIAQDAIETASYICEDYYGLIEGPEIQLICPTKDIHFMYVPGHLIHMLFETLKNSLRATIETHTPLLKAKMMEENRKLKPEDIDINDLKFPPIKVIISEGSEDIAIKISDEGGGIPISQIPLIWTYLYTTVNETPVLESDGNTSSFKAPMAGFGYGLPISRLYAQYFGGDLKLISMEGYGTDVYLHLNRLSSSLEPLP